MTAKEEITEIFRECRMIEHVDPKLNESFKGIYKALYALADRIDKEAEK